MLIFRRLRARIECETHDELERRHREANLRFQQVESKPLCSPLEKLVNETFEETATVKRQKAAYDPRSSPQAIPQRSRHSTRGVLAADRSLRYAEEEQTNSKLKRGMMTRELLNLSCLIGFLAIVPGCSRHEAAPPVNKMGLPNGINVDDVLEQMRVLEAAMDPAKAAAPHAKVAFAFARALADGDFDRVNEMLTPALRDELTPAKLKDKYSRMTGRAGYLPATDVEVVSVMEDWPTKEHSDVGWVYVSISGPHQIGGGWGEAVTVIVSDVGERLLIRSVDWGRP